MHRLQSLGSAAAFLGLSLTAFAQQDCRTYFVPPTETSFTTTIHVSKFDASGGNVLTSVTIDVGGRGDGALFMENHNATPVTVTSHFSGNWFVKRPDATTIVSGSFDQAFSDNLAAFDGNQNFAGPSGETHNGLSVTFNGTHVSPPPLSDLLLFTGAGTVALTVQVTNTSSFSPTSNITTDVKQSADVKIDVCYRYEKDCNHNGIADDVDIQNGAHDINNNGIPDECEGGTKERCEGGGQATGTVNCPCGNNLPAGQHGGCLNQNGVGAHLFATGTPSIANDTLVLHADNGNPGPGFFFTGTALTNGGMGATFGNGLRCIGGTVVRIRKIPNGTGIATLPTPPLPPIHILLGLVAGDTRYFQVWYRDPLGPCGQPFNTSNVVQVTFGL